MSWAGRCGPICPRPISPAHCSGRCWPNGPLPASSFIPTEYVGNAYKALLRDAQARLSHSRRGKCYDNALLGTTQAESLWSRRKTEELKARDWFVFTDLADAQASVADYFDYCNHERRHSSIGCMKPYQLH